MGSRSAPQAPLPPRRIVKRSKHLLQTASSGLMAALEGNHETGKAIPLIFVPRFGILSEKERNHEYVNGQPHMQRTLCCITSISS